ncbi:MAG: type I-E CRISPR-associated protein Cse1/CasA [Thiothrix sp.]|nr:MAG: type I-E CRISPR-associated protein Cse1/CasA [Thiothrix sp.]
MPLNLLLDAWIPVQREQDEDLIAPWQLTETPNPILRLNAPRADFNGALMQFLIAVLQTTIPPKNDEVWADSLVEPPTPEQLKQKFTPFAYAFEVQHEKGSFMQDFEALNTEPNGISDLLIDAPGGNTIKENKDFFVKRGRVEQLCPSCAVTALFTLQTNAPSGGAGHRTSIRGGGPLTTLIIVDDKAQSGSSQEVLLNDLWRNVWLNVLDLNTAKTLTGDLEKTDKAAMFPWLAPTRTSEKGGKDTTAIDVHPWQMYWAMPRRIRIEWDSKLEGQCDICYVHCKRLVTHYQTKNYGVNYIGAWQHPLSPYSLTKKGEWLPQHAQPNGMTYQHWLGFMKNNENQISASVVKRYLKVAPEWEEVVRLHVFGYDMDNMKARCWYEATFPIYIVPADVRLAFSNNIEHLTASATEVAGYVRSCVKDAWFSRPSDVKGDTSFITKSFYQHTEAKFFQFAKNLPHHLQQRSEKELLNQWHEVLRTTAFQVFDYWAASGDIAQGDPCKIANARTKLLKLLYGNAIKKTLMLPPSPKETKAKEAA